MKLKIDKYTIDFKEEIIRRSRKSTWVSSQVRSLEWTSLDKDLLTEKVAEIYDMIKGRDGEN